MLTIRTALVEAFKRNAFEGYLRELVEVCWEYAPRLCKTLDEAELEHAIRCAMERAGRYGFVQRGPVRFFVQTSIALGSEFDEDPQYPWVQTVLTDGRYWSPIDKAKALHARLADHLEHAEGHGNVHSREALKQFRTLVSRDLQLSQALEHDTLQLLRQVHPHKADQVGDHALRSLLQSGVEKCQTLGFQQPRAQLLVLALMFAVGHAFDRDPFLPWLRRTLALEQRAIPAERIAERLERRTLIWVDAVLSAEEKKL